MLNTLTLPRTSNSLAHYAKGTRSLPNPPKRAGLLPPFVSIRFQVYFTPLFRVLFTFPSRYWYTIGHKRVFSLTGWFRQIPTEFPLLRGTQGILHAHHDFVYGTFTLYGQPFQSCLTINSGRYRGPTTPMSKSASVWAVPVSLAATQGITIVFSSSGYLDVSVLRVSSRRSG